MKNRTAKAKRRATSKKQKPVPTTKGIIVGILTSEPFLMTKEKARLFAEIFVKQSGPAVRKARIRLDKLDAVI